MWVRLNTIFNFIDYRGVTPHKINSGIPLLTAKNIKNGFIDYEIQEFISKVEFEKRKNRGISKFGDILFTTEAPLGNAAIADKDIYSAGQRLITFQQYTKHQYLLNKLYMFFILSENFQSELNKKKTGSTVFGIKAEKLKCILIPLTPYKEQIKILNKIDSIIIKLYKLHKSINKFNTLQQHLRSKLLDSIFSPNSSYKSYYENKKLSEVSKITMGQSPKGEDITNNANKGCLEFHQGKLDFGELVINDSHKYAIKYNKIAEPGSILFSVRAPVGSINFTDRKIAIGRGLCSILPYDNMVDKKFLYYQLLYLKNYFVEKGTGSTFQAITVDVLRNSIIFICNIEMQKIIVKKIDKIFKLIDNM